MSRQSCCTELFCLAQCSHLEQLEGPWVQLVETADPESVAVALRLFHSHLMWTIEKLGATIVISEWEESLEAIKCSEPQR